MDKREFHLSRKIVEKAKQYGTREEAFGLMAAWLAHETGESFEVAVASVLAALDSGENTDSEGHKMMVNIIAGMSLALALMNEYRDSGHKYNPDTGETIRVTKSNKAVEA